MVRNRIDEPDAAGLPARRVPAHARAGRGARRDDRHHRHGSTRRGADRRPRRAGRPAAARARTRGGADDTEDVIRRRQEVYAEQTAPLIEVYRTRGLVVEVDGMGEVDEVTERIFEPWSRHRRVAELSTVGAVFREPWDRDQDAAEIAGCGRPGWSSGGPSSCCGEIVRPGHHHR
jgi:hypothetical protein